MNNNVAATNGLDRQSAGLSQSGPRGEWEVDHDQHSSNYHKQVTSRPSLVTFRLIYEAAEAEIARFLPGLVRREI